jgi:tetratricopeptide (TPR) repeat protein
MAAPVWYVILMGAAVLAVQAQDRVCDRGASEALENEAVGAMRARDYVLAERRLTEAFDLCPERPSVLLQLTQAQVAGRNFEGAIRTARHYLAVDPSSAAGRLALANVYLMALRLKEALAEADAILRDRPQDSAALKIKANAAYLLGDVEMAKATFIRLLDRYPADEDGAYMLGRIYYQEGFIDLAKGQFERVVKTNPGAYKALDNLGLCYEAEGDYEGATRYYLTAIKLVEKDHPEYEWPYTNLADLLVKTGDAQRGFDAASKAVNRNPMSTRGFYVGAKALNQLGKPELALNWLQRAAALNATSSETWYLLGLVYGKLHQNDKAEEAMRTFRELKAREPARRR